MLQHVWESAVAGWAKTGLPLWVLLLGLVVVGVLLSQLSWAPVYVSAARRFETFMVMISVGSQFFGISLAIFLLYWGGWMRILMLLYLGWIAIDSFVLRTPARGGRLIRSFRHAPYWKAFAKYFPLRLHRDGDSPLDTDSNYIFALHPHGVIGVSVFGNFATEATGFSQLFPGIDVSIMALNLVTRIPFSREIMMRLGVLEVSRQSIQHKLTRMGKGQAAVIVVGGAREALDATPGAMKLTLAKRMGFVKMALRTGASLVPVLSFGENDVYRQVGGGGGWLRRIQTRLMSWMRFSIPLVYGRGIFNYSFGWMPFRREINTVVGQPIAVEQDSDPLREKVQKLHAAYIQQLTDLYDTYAPKFGQNIKGGLQIV